MCRFPIHIANRSRSFRDACCPTQFVVPCGHCSECRRSVQDDWFVRSFYEYKDCLSKGGQVFLILLTIDDEHLPLWSDTRYQPWEKYGFTIPVFDPSYLKSFRDKVRVFVTRKFGKERARGIKFFFASEYGHKTGRPHYHALIYLPFSVSKNEFIGTSNNKYTDGIFARAWSFGFIGVNKKHGCLVFNANGLAYVMKYLHKRDKWSKLYDLDKYRIFLSEYAALEDEPDKHTRKYRLFLRSCPRHYQSKSFGVCGLQYYCSPDGEPCYDKFLDKVNLSSLGYISKHTYNVPRYFYRKCFYDFDKVNEVAFLNDYGQKMKRLEFDRLLDLKYDSIQQYFHYGNFCSLCNSVPKDYLLNFLSKHDCSNVRALHDKIFNVTLDRQTFDVKLFSLYCVVYRFLNVKDYQYFKSYCFSEQINFVKDNAYDIFTSRFVHNPYTVYPSGQQPYYSDRNFTLHPDFSSFPVFDGYNDSQLLLEQFSALVNEFKEQRQIEQDSINDDLKWMYDDNPYIHP